MVFDNAKFSILVDRLEQVFGPDHKVVHFIGGVLPQSTSIIEPYTIADLRKDDVVKKFTTASTLFVPPSVEARVNKIMVRELGLEDSLAEFQKGSNQSVLLQAGAVVYPALVYGPHEQSVIAQIDKDAAPDTLRVLQASDAMKKLMVDLVLKPKLLEEYRGNSLEFVDKVAGLALQEKVALTLCAAGPIYTVMSASQTDIAQGHQWSTEELEAVAVPLNFTAPAPVILLLSAAPNFTAAAPLNFTIAAH